MDELLQKAQKYLQSAAVMLELEDFDSCASRVYFAMFYAARALLQTQGLSNTTTQSVRTVFTNAFVTTGVLPEHAAMVFERAAKLQENGDYSQGFSVSHEDAEDILAEGEAFVNSIERLGRLQVSE